MISKQPKQILTVLAVLLLFTIISYSCNNSADTSKTTTDTGSKMSAQPDTTKKVDTTKMDTASTRPIKVSS